ncbi:MAG: DUF3810 domain-containing protein [Oscillibacter sp.]|nr:DUF3810 domain-containing protein [Oscillibacter sp.]MBQ7778810.1 DUF3810 domain-containing protein [Oscillibacter sp.]
MKQRFLNHKIKHIWLLADICLLAAFWLCKENQRLMTLLAEHVTVPFRQALGKLSYLVEVSVMEVLCVALVIAAPVYVVWQITAIVRAKGNRKPRAYSAILLTLCLAMTAWVGVCFFLGIDSYADGFQEKSGIYAEPVAPEDLLAVTLYFTENLVEAADRVERDEDGAFAVPREEILKGSTRAYAWVDEEFPFLSFDDPGVKPIRFSKVMSALDFTGMYCPFTGESNVNMDSPACLLASTVSHELAHQRGITSEQEANFLAILAATTCGDDTYAYAGWLSGYINLSNAVYRIDPELYRMIWALLPETVQEDLRRQSDYWDQFRDKTPQKVSNQVYDSFLKGYNQELGLQSYGTVVDLLVVYYKNRI